MIYLFDTTESAEQVAYLVSGNWDGCNGVEFPDHAFDAAAFTLAVKLCDAQACRVGNHQPLNPIDPFDLIQTHPLMSEVLYTLNDLALQAARKAAPRMPDKTVVINDVFNVASDLGVLPDSSKITFPVSRAEVYWAIADWANGPYTAQEIAAGLRFVKSTVQGHLSALEKAGAIHSNNRPKQYTVNADCPEEYLRQLQSLAGLARFTRGLS